MSVCNICNRKETRNRELITDTNICTECMEKIKYHNYEIKYPNYEILHKKDESISKELPCDNGTNQSNLYNSSCDEDEEEMEQKPEFNNNSNFKDDLLATLYAQVDFWKHEIAKKNLLIRTLTIKESDVYTAAPYHFTIARQYTCYPESTNNSKNSISIMEATLNNKTDASMISANDVNS